MKLLRILLVAAAVLVAAGAGAYVFREALIGRWIERNLAASLSSALDADVEFDGLAWKDGVLHAARCRMSGGNLPFEKLEASGLRTPLDWRRLMEPLRESVSIEADRADLVWRSVEKPAGRAGGGDSRRQAPPSMDLAIGRFSFSQPGARGWSMKDTALRARLDAGEWSLTTQGGSAGLPGLANLQLEKLSARQHGNSWLVDSFALNDGQGGGVEGSAIHEDGAWSGEFTWRNLDAGKLLAAPSAAHFSGKTSGSATLEKGLLRGRMTITGAETKTVPALVKMASLFVLENWETVPWETFRFEFTRAADGTVSFSALEASSTKGLTVRGSGRIGADSLAADLELGVRRDGRPWLVAFMPVLFRTEKDGYLWVPVRVGGTPAAPTEDLTARVVAALAMVPAAGAVEAAAKMPGAAAEAAGSLLETLMGR